MTKIFNFTKTQERGRERVFCVCLGMQENEGLYSSGGGNMNGKSFNKG